MIIHPSVSLKTFDGLNCKDHSAESDLIFLIYILRQKLPREMGTALKFSSEFRTINKILLGKLLILFIRFRNVFTQTFARKIIHNRVSISRNGSPKIDCNNFFMQN